MQHFGTTFALEQIHPEGATPLELKLHTTWELANICMECNLSLSALMAISLLVSASHGSSRVPPAPKDLVIPFRKTQRHTVA
jgi:hypothetical protein